MGILKKATACFLMIILLLLTPVNAFAIDTAFIDNPEIWYEKSGIYHASEQKFEDFSGMFSYYTDIENNCFYLHISYNEKGLTDEENDVKVEFHISNDTNAYTFVFDENGITEPGNEVKKAFDAVCNFGNATAQGQELYLGIEFRNKVDKQVDNILSFSVSVNGKSYKLTDGIKLPFYKEESAKEKDNVNTSATREAKTSRKSTEKNSSSKVTTEKPTKFKYIPSQSSNSREEYETNDTVLSEGEFAETKDNGVEIIAEEEKKPKLSTASKILIAVAVLSILTGIALISYYSFKAKKDKPEKQDEV